MDKHTFKKFALMGMAGGMLLASQTPGTAEASNNERTYLAGSCGGKSSCGGQSKNARAHSCGGQNNSPRSHSCGGSQPTNWPRNPTAFNDTMPQQQQSGQPHLMDETEFMSKLNAEEKNTYKNLSSEGKALAMKLANGSCEGKNECKGLSGCKTSTNVTCAGKNACQGKGTGMFKDKNVAVKVAAQKMAEKRSGAAAGSPQAKNKSSNNNNGQTWSY